MKELLDFIRNYIMLTIVVSYGPIYGAETQFLVAGLPLSDLSQRARAFLYGPVIENNRIRNLNGSFVDVSFSNPKCRKMLISFCDNMTDVQINAVFESAVSEMRVLYERIIAGGDSARRACEDVLHNRPACQQGSLFLQFLAKRVPLRRLGEIAGLRRYKNNSPFSINTMEDRKLFIALCGAVLNRVIDELNWHNQDMMENRRDDGMYLADGGIRLDTEQEHDDHFYNDTLVKTFSEPDSSGNAWYGLTSAVREVIENIH